MEEKTLPPLRFLPDGREFPWGRSEYRLADLGFVDSMAAEGWLGGNTLSDILQTYLERLVGETAFDWYGTQFPVLVKWLEVRGRTSLHVNPADDPAQQRYDAFGKTALWYVASCGPDARLFLGWKRDVSAAECYRACLDGSVETLLHSTVPQPGESYLILPGQVHAAQDVQLLEIAEASELSFRLYDWGARDREIHLEEAIDLIDFKAWPQEGVPGKALPAVTPQFSVRQMRLLEPIRNQSRGEDSFLVYVCTAGSAVLQAGKAYPLNTGDVLLVPSELTDFQLLPVGGVAELLEVRLDPRPDDDLVSDPIEEA